jgi:GldM C-terminal domain
MSKLLALLTMLILYCIGYTQKFTVAADNMNVLHVGVRNPLTVTVAGYPPEAVYLKTNKGTVEGGSGSYTIMVDSPGAVKLTIFVKTKSSYKKIGNAFFRVRQISDPVLKVGPCGGCEIQKKVLAAQEFIRGEFNDEFITICANCQVQKYLVVIVRGDSVILNKFCTGAKIPKDISDAIASLGNNDMVIFKDAACTGPDGKLLNLKPIIFTIKE